MSDELVWEPLRPGDLDARVEAMIEAILDKIPDAALSRDPAVMLVRCNDCGRAEDPREWPVDGWRSARALEPYTLITEHGPVQIQGWIDLCPRCVLTRHLARYGAAPPR